MFPIPWNFPFRKKNGDMSTIGAEIGGAGSELPPHSSSDAGKLLGVKPNGSLEWSDTVNSEIQTLTNNLADEVSARAKLGAHNLALPLNDITNSTYGLTITTDSNGVSTVSGTATSNGGRLNHVSNAFTLKAGSYKLYSNRSDENIYCDIAVSNNSDSTRIASTDTNNVVEFTINVDTNVVIGLNTKTGVVYSNGFNIKPMITLISDTSNEFTPYAMTNRELTNRIVVHTDVITFNENGKYIFSGGKEIISARVLSTGNYVVLIGNNAANSVFVLYNHEGTNWTRITTQPQLTVKWVEVLI